MTEPTVVVNPPDTTREQHTLPFTVTLSEYQLLEWVEHGGVLTVKYETPTQEALDLAQKIQTRNSKWNARHHGDPRSESIKENNED